MIGVFFLHLFDLSNCLPTNCDSSLRHLLRVCICHFRGQYHPLKIQNHKKITQSCQKNNSKLYRLLKFSKSPIFGRNMANLKLCKKVLLILHSVTHLKSNQKVIKNQNFQNLKKYKKMGKMGVRVNFINIYSHKMI